MFQHVLVPFYARPLPKTALMTASILSNEQDADLTLLCMCDEYNEPVRRSIEDALAIVSEFGSSASARYAFGAPPQQIIKAAAGTLNADLIVMGTDVRRALACAQPDVPVLVIRESSTTLAKALRNERTRP